MLAAGALALAIACSASAPRPTAKVAPPPDPTSCQKDWPKTWKDPRVVDALAAACDFDPKLPPPEDGHFDTPPDMFRCTVGYAQSCTPDVCFSTACEKGCTSTCLGCSGACTTSCTSCKSACTDDACRHRCAEQCAQCKDGCIDTLDRCATADCGKVHADCEKRVAAAYKKASCAVKCPRWLKCAEACENAKDSTACIHRCATAAAPRFDACQDACEALGEKQPDSCMLDCYLAEPCAPFLCNYMTLRP